MIDAGKTSNSGGFVVREREREKKEAGEKDGKTVCERQQS